LNETEVKRVGASPIKSILDKIAGLFPVNESAYTQLNKTNLQNSDSSTLREALLYLEKLGVGTLLGIYTSRDDKDPVSPASFKCFNVSHRHRFMSHL
jgi:hypothetical protein